MKHNLLYIFLFVFVLMTLGACTQDKKLLPQDTDLLHDRVASAVIYEVNIRQYTPEGTFRSFEQHIPRLREMGVDILWLMPVYPIGEVNRKGTLGSYYSVKDYYGINPDYGTASDLHHLIQTAHENGMLVILDWVADHTSWDNPWVKQHPDWYEHNKDGSLRSPFDWTDVVKLDYKNKQMRDEMVNAMKYWVRVFDIDGFRCDVAMMVPRDFWDSARVELNKIKPVFMLAEAEQPDLMYSAFDAYYGWHLFHIMNQISQGKMDARELRKYFRGHARQFPHRAMRMNFTSNHDENSWNGTVYERMPKSYKTFAVFTFLVPDMPLIYSGQEACLDKRLKFFDKDQIKWKNCEMANLYHRLIQLKHTHPALRGGAMRGKFVLINNTLPRKVFAFARYTKGDTIIAVFNLSDTTVTTRIKSAVPYGNYTEYFTHQRQRLAKNTSLTLGPWEYRVFVKERD